METTPNKMPLVWVDTRSRLYYYPANDRYGNTPGGKYLKVEEAKTQGYRSFMR
jgi:hypothetical protein